MAWRSSASSSTSSTCSPWPDRPVASWGAGADTSPVACGSSIETTVPRPGALSMRTVPPDWAAKPCSCDRPSPLPAPGGLVVKNGSNACARTSSDMPHPVSATLMWTYRPWAGRSAPGMVSSGPDAQEAEIITRPWPAIASRALITRFSSAASIWPRSARTVHEGAASTDSEMPSPSVRASRSRMPPMTCSGSSTSGDRRWRREKESSWLVRRAARRDPSSALSASLAPRSSRVPRCRSSSSEPMMVVSRLLKSCAMPPVSWPTASIFCAWCSRSSAACSAAAVSRASVTSVIAAITRSRRPAGSRSISSTTSRSRT